MDKAMQKLLMEMDNQLNKSQAELSIVNLQLGRVDTNLKLIEHTRKQIARHCEKDETVWQGIGKAFVGRPTGSYLKEMDADESQFKETKSGLEKKKVYLETTVEKTADNMRQLVGKV